MKKYKLLQNRPSLTNRQVTEGMDFNKIKNNAALAKPTVLKSLFIKGLLGIITISVVVFLYKNYENPSTGKVQAIAVKPVTLPEKIISNNIKVISDNYPVHATTHKTMAPVKTSISLKEPDSIRPLTASVNNHELKRNADLETGYHSGSYSYPNDKVMKVTDDLTVYSVTLGKTEIKEIDRSLAKINEGLYASKYEVTNGLYMTFLNSLRQSANTKLLAVAEIDTLRWRDKSSYNEPYVHYYHAHPAYQNYPVVNITYEGATLFCEWLTVQYNSNLKKEFTKVRFRLPSEEEWEAAARAGDSAAIYPWKGKDMRNKKGQIMANFRNDLPGELVVNGKHENLGDITTPVEAYWSNDYGLFNMSGNVAEMTTEKGITKGGSWKDIPELLRIDASYKYDGSAQPFVGFRYFAEIEEK